MSFIFVMNVILMIKKFLLRMALDGTGYAQAYKVKCCANENICERFLQMKMRRGRCRLFFSILFEGRTCDGGAVCDSQAT